MRKGEHGIRILAPLVGVRRKKDEEAEQRLSGFGYQERLAVGFGARGGIRKAPMGVTLSFGNLQRAVELVSK